MTIRRNVNIDAANSDYSDFLTGVEAAEEGQLSFCRNLKFEIGEACDDFLRSMKRIGAKTCNCDGIREIEVLMFDMVRRNTPDSQIETAIKVGDRIDEGERFAVGDMIDRLEDERIERAGGPVFADADDSEERFGLEPIFGNTDY